MLPLFRGEHFRQLSRFQCEGRVFKGLVHPRFCRGYPHQWQQLRVTSSWIEKQIKRRNLGTPDDVNDFKPGRKIWSSPEACGNTPNSLFVEGPGQGWTGPVCQRIDVCMCI
jgi:hypothetical protein